MLKQNNIAGVILTRSVFKSVGEIPLSFVVIDEQQSHGNYYESVDRELFLY